MKNLKIVFLDTLTLGNSSLKRFTNLQDKYKNKLDIEMIFFEKTSSKDTLERVKDAQIVVTNKVIINSEIMKNSNIKMICVTATGVNNIDLETAKSKNILVNNVAGYSTESVLSLTFSMLFYLVNSSKYYDNYVKNGSYENSPVFTHIGQDFYELKGKKVGIIGFGTIGKRVAQVFEAFGSTVFYYSTSGSNNDSNYSRLELNKLLETCDIISIHAPLNSNTKYLLNKNNLYLIKDNATILNLGRGGIINENDLISVMKEKKNLKVGLDVLEQEPIIKNHKLLTFKDRVYISPHIAWTGVEARERLLDTTKSQIEEYINSNF
jgi:glycerate dehydrogenase